MESKSMDRRILPPRRGNRGNRGYTLTEIALAVLILGIGLTGVLSVFPVAVTWGGKAIAGKTALQQAGHKLGLAVGKALVKHKKAAPEKPRRKEPAK